MLWGEEQAESSNALEEVWVRSAKKERRIWGGRKTGGGEQCRKGGGQRATERARQQRRGLDTAGGGWAWQDGEGLGGSGSEWRDWRDGRDWASRMASVLASLVNGRRGLDIVDVSVGCRWWIGGEQLWWMGLDWIRLELDWTGLVESSFFLFFCFPLVAAIAAPATMMTTAGSVPLPVTLPVTRFLLQSLRNSTVIIIHYNHNHHHNHASLPTASRVDHRTVAVSTALAGLFSLRASSAVSALIPRSEASGTCSAQWGRGQQQKNRQAAREARIECFLQRRRWSLPVTQRVPLATRIRDCSTSQDGRLVGIGLVRWSTRRSRSFDRPVTPPAAPGIRSAGRSGTYSLSAPWLSSRNGRRCSWTVRSSIRNNSSERTAIKAIMHRVSLVPSQAG